MRKLISEVRDRIWRPSRVDGKAIENATIRKRRMGGMSIDLLPLTMVRELSPTGRESVEDPWRNQRRNWGNLTTN